MKIIGKNWAKKFKEQGVPAFELRERKKWRDSFKWVRDFVKKNGWYQTQKGGRLGAWCGKQRRSWKKGELSEGQVRMLKSLPGWKWDVRKEIWQDSFEQVVDFEKRLEKCPGWKDGKLGAWCRNQKQLKKRGELSEERVKMLGTISGWNWETDFEKRWRESFEQVRDFEKNSGRCPRERDGEMGLWCCHQRRLEKNDKLPEERVKLLETIPSWRWLAES